MEKENRIISSLLFTTLIISNNSGGLIKWQDLSIEFKVICNKLYRLYNNIW